MTEVSEKPINIKYTGYSRDDKIRIMDDFFARAVDVKKYGGLHRAAQDAGLAVTGRATHYNALRKWREEDAELNDIFCGALLARAEEYQSLAQAEMDKVRDRVNVYYDTWINTGGRCREMQTVVNAGKFAVDRYQHLASLLCPEVYGDYYHEIKRCEQEIKSIKNQLDQLLKY